MGGFRVIDPNRPSITSTPIAGRQGKPVQRIAAAVVDGRLVAVTTSVREYEPVKVWDVATGDLLGSLDTSNATELAAATVDGRVPSPSPPATTRRWCGIWRPISRSATRAAVWHRLPEALTLSRCEPCG